MKYLGSYRSLKCGFIHDTAKSAPCLNLSLTEAKAASLQNHLSGLYEMVCHRGFFWLGFPLYWVPSVNGRGPVGMGTCIHGSRPVVDTGMHSIRTPVARLNGLP